MTESNEAYTEWPLERSTVADRYGFPGREDVPDWLFYEMVPLYAENECVTDVHVCKLCGDHWKYSRYQEVGRRRLGVFLIRYCNLCTEAIRVNADLVVLIERVSNFSARWIAESVVEQRLKAFSPLLMKGAFDAGEAAIDEARKGL